MRERRVASPSGRRGYEVTDPFDRLVADGETVLEEWCSDEREEDLFLEFKQKSGPGPGLSENDKKNLYKAASAFANGDGGTLVWGAKSDRVAGADRLIELVPIPDIAKFRARLLDCLSNATSPPVDGIEVVAIPCSAKPGSGYIAMRIPASTRRPHQASLHQRYYRRGSTGNRVMEHSEVQEMILAGTHAKLSTEYQVLRGVQTGKIRMQLKLVISLRNHTGVMTAFPYLLIDSGGRLHFENLLGGSPVLHPDGYSGIYGGAHRIIHAYDILPMAALLLSVRVVDGDEFELAIGDSERWTRVSKFALSELGLRYGAQNALPATEERTWTGPELLHEARTFIERLM